MEAPQNRNSMERWSASPFDPAEKGRTSGKTYGIKSRCYWKHPWGTHWELREHTENLMRTHWELEGNMLGTKEK
jgi:hypothetical protein